MAMATRVGQALARAAAGARSAAAPAIRAHGVQKLQVRAVSSSAVRMHGHKHKEEEEMVSLRGSVPIDHHDHDHDEDVDDDEDDEDMEDMVSIGPMGKEWGGPTRGGKFKEPTRYGDWERKGRCTDF